MAEIKYQQQQKVRDKAPNEKKTTKISEEKIYDISCQLQRCDSGFNLTCMRCVCAFPDFAIKKIGEKAAGTVKCTHTHRKRENKIEKPKIIFCWFFLWPPNESVYVLSLIRHTQSTKKPYVLTNCLFCIARSFSVCFCLWCMGCEYKKSINEFPKFWFLLFRRWARRFNCLPARLMTFLVNSVTQKKTSSKLKNIFGSATNMAVIIINVIELCECCHRATMRTGQKLTHKQSAL